MQPQLERSCQSFKINHIQIQKAFESILYRPAFKSAVGGIHHFINIINRYLDGLLLVLIRISSFEVKLIRVLRLTYLLSDLELSLELSSKKLYGPMLHGQ